jgi:hypothetical protein
VLLSPAADKPIQFRVAPLPGRGCYEVVDAIGAVQKLAFVGTEKRPLY